MKSIERFDKQLKLINDLKLDIIDFALIKADSTWRHLGVKSSFNRIYFVLSGSGYLKGEDNITILEPGYMYLIPPNITLDYICDNHIEKLYIHCNIEMILGIDVFEGLGKCIKLPYKKEKVEKIVKEIKNNSLNSVMAVKAELIKVVADFQGNSDLANQSYIDYSPYTKYADVLIMINQNLRADLRINEIAKWENQTPQTLARNFKKDTGAGLKSYIEMVLIKRIKEQLLTSDKSLKEIAATLKFCDQYYLTRFFTKHVGESPTAYKRKNIITRNKTKGG